MDVLWKAFLSDGRHGGEIPSFLHGANVVSPGKKEQKGPAGPLRHFLPSPLPKSWTFVICGHCSVLVSKSQCHPLTFSFTHVFP